VLDIFQQIYDIAAIYSHQETGNMRTYERDIAVAQYLDKSGIPWYQSPSNGVVRCLQDRDNWSKIWNSRMTAPIYPRPENLLKPVFVAQVPRDEWKTDKIRNIHIQV
jgi:deoxyribodipyrimidine photo-lyase